MSKPRIFITGAGGMLGRALVRALLVRGFQVTGFGLGEQYYRQQSFFNALPQDGEFTFEIGSILDRLAVASAMIGATAVIHLAAMMGKRTETERLRCLDINVHGTENVLSAAVAAQISRFIYVSSSAVYGETAADRVDELAETKPRNVYAVSKLAGEELTKAYTQLYPQMSYTIIRPFNTYGNEVDGHIALNAFAARVAGGLPPIINGDGTQRRCYVHADDVATAILAMLDGNVAENKIYNIGNPDQVFSLNELARKVIDILAPDSGLNTLADKSAPRRDNIQHSVADISLAARELGYRPAITVEEGLRRIAAGLQRHVP